MYDFSGLRRGGLERALLAVSGGIDGVALLAQRAGQAGPLASNGWGNQFYIRDTAGVLRGVNVHWCDDGWGVDLALEAVE